VVRLPAPLTQRFAALLRPLSARVLARVSEARTQLAWPRPAASSAPPASAELLEVALDALNIARDNKALVVARQGTIIDINQRALELCGYTSGDLLGRNAMDALFEGPPAEPAASRWNTQLKNRSRETIAIEVVRQPLGSRLSDIEVYAMRDLRERREAAEERDRQHKALEQRDEALRTQDLRFKTALDNMGKGLCMFDGQKRLVVCNDLYGQMYRLPPELLQIGAPHSAVIAHRVMTGILKGEKTGEAVDQKLSNLKDLPADSQSSRIDELADGRLIRVTRQPMPGGGWVAIHEDVTERHQTEARIAHMARHDALTDLPNRIEFEEQIHAALLRTQKGEHAAILSLDLDRFKQVNDTLGHPVGDALLKIVAGRLRRIVREDDTVARLGGDEFAIIQLGAVQPEGATNLAQRLIDAISAPYDIEGHQIVIGTSVGIAIAPTDGDAVATLLKSADVALYRAKTDGRGRYRFFEPGMDAAMQARRTLELDLRAALVNGEFELHYQPLVNIATRQVTGFEALLRWRHPARGLVSPADFIPLAEEIGLIVPIGEWVLRQACGDAASWPDHITVAVNLSPAQFKSARLSETVMLALASSGLPPHRLELEITEGVLLVEHATTLAVLHQLRSLGVRIAMDDFGTGYSSLSYLRSFPFDKIKIDRSFIQNMAQDESSSAIVRAVVGLSARLGMATTAEGVETAEQLEGVRAEGCTEVQGFYFSRAKPACEVLAMIGTARTVEAAVA
jgi:diguanylate cyclase (GGDEF)-like protein/PAS domain S-box-containing protein